jgi:hypothetical protein
VSPEAPVPLQATAEVLVGPSTNEGVAVPIAIVPFPALTPAHADVAQTAANLAPLLLLVWREVVTKTLPDTESYTGLLSFTLATITGHGAPASAGVPENTPVLM